MIQHRSVGHAQGRKRKAGNAAAWRVSGGLGVAVAAGRAADGLVEQELAQVCEVVVQSRVADESDRGGGLFQGDGQVPERLGQAVRALGVVDPGVLDEEGDRLGPRQPFRAAGAVLTARAAAPVAACGGVFFAVRADACVAPARVGASVAAVCVKASFAAHAETPVAVWAKASLAVCMEALVAARAGAPALVCVRAPVVAGIGFGEFFGGGAQEFVVQVVGGGRESCALALRAEGGEEGQEPVGVGPGSDGLARLAGSSCDGVGGGLDGAVDFAPLGLGGGPLKTRVYDVGQSGRDAPGPPGGLRRAVGRRRRADGRHRVDGRRRRFVCQCRRAGCRGLVEK